MSDSTRPRAMILASKAEQLRSAVNSICDDELPSAAYTHAKTALSEFRDAQIVFGNPQMIAEIAADLPNLKWVQSSWAGVNPLLNLPDTVALTGVKDVFGEQMSEYVFAYILNHCLQISERDQLQKERRWDPRPSLRLAGKTMGVLGTGSIGKHIASTGRVFGMQLRGCSLSGSKSVEFDTVYPVSALHEFLTDLDFLVCILPATSETNGLLDAQALRLPGKNCVLINVGRGNLIDTDALRDVLSDGGLAAAVLDVFENEPLQADDRLWSVPNLRVTPHIAAVSESALIAPLFVDNYRNYCEGKPLKFLVDKRKGY